MWPHTQKGISSRRRIKTDGTVNVIGVGALRKEYPAEEGLRHIVAEGIMPYQVSERNIQQKKD